MSRRGAGGGRAAGLLCLARSAALALSMFSRIPAPSRPPWWEGEPMRRALAFWPLVGLAQGALVVAWAAVCASAPVPDPLRALVFLVIPPLVNGGIHFDGMADTADALAARADRARSLEVMADPGAGSFAVLQLGLYLAAALCLFWCMPRGIGPAAAVALSFVLSRAAAGITLAAGPCAHKGGLAWAFSNRLTGGARAALVVVAVLACAGMAAAWTPWGVLAAAAQALVAAWYLPMVRRRFGGVTGDTCGWLVQWSELAALAAVVLGGLLA